MRCEASLGTAMLVAARPESAHRLQNMPIPWGIDNERNNGSEFDDQAVVCPWKRNDHELRVMAIQALFTST